MPTPIFQGKVKGGKMLLEDKQSMINWLLSLEGKQIQIVIDKKKRRRTSGKQHEAGNQNGYYRAVILPIVADYSGERTEAMHEQLLQLYAPKVPTQVLGDTVLQPIRSSNMSTVQFKEFCDTITQKMDELNVHIPEPTKVR